MLKVINIYSSTNQNNTINNTNNTDYDTESVSDIESEISDNEYKKFTSFKDIELINYINSIACFFVSTERYKNIKMICYNCNNKTKSQNIEIFGKRFNQGKIVSDVPICPYCYSDSLIDRNKFKKRNINIKNLLCRMKKLKNK